MKFLIPVLCGVAPVWAAPGGGIGGMRCEYNVSPVNIDTGSPRFTWTCSEIVPVRYTVRLAASEKDLVNNRKGVMWQKTVAAGNLPVKYDGKKALEPHTTYYWQVIASDRGGKQVVSPVASFSTAKLSDADWSAFWISDSLDKEVEAAPMLRKTFSVGKGVSDARIYVSSAGYNEIRINGERVDDSHMNPGYTHFDKRLLYDVIDVTPFLKEGENVITAVLGNGFFNCQSTAVWNFENARWRERPALLCEIIAKDSGGKGICLVQTDSSWQSATGPYTYNNIYSGDRYDGRLEIEDWHNAGVERLPLPDVVRVASPAPLLKAQMQPPIRPTEIIRPTLVKSWGDTIFVFDMGKNISGVCELTARGERGTHFRLSHGEMLKNDLRLQQGNIDIYYRPEKPGEKFQTDEFILAGNGGCESFKPMFTYHGFRFVEVTADRPVNLTADNVKGYLMHTDVERVGNFECSNEVLNKLYNATILSYVDNLHSIPTDCPQREKNGWTADAHAAIDLALLNYDGITFYEKWMNDFIDNQKEDGNISGVIPTSDWGYGDSPGPVWDAALFIIPGSHI